MRNYFTIIIISIILFSCDQPTRTHKTFVSGNYKPFIGIWANNNCELVQTSKFILLFHRADDTYTSVLWQIVPSQYGMSFKKLGQVNFQSETKEADGYISNNSDVNESSIESGLLISNISYFIKKEKSKIVLKSKKGISEELNFRGNEITIIFPDKTAEILTLVEKIQIADSRIDPVIQKQNIDECLIKWQLGSKLVIDEKFLSASIFTNHHSYFFGVRKDLAINILYCRAARIKASNSGIVYHQNIRLMQNPLEYSSWIADNNLDLLSEDLRINEEYFDESCDCDESYWKIKKYNKTVIDLSSHRGVIYRIKRPLVNSEDFIERFEYLKDKEI